MCQRWVGKRRCRGPDGGWDGKPWGGIDDALMIYLLAIHPALLLLYPQSIPALATLPSSSILGLLPPPFPSRDEGVRIHSLDVFFFFSPSRFSFSSLKTSPADPLIFVNISFSKVRYNDMLDLSSRHRKLPYLDHVT